MGETLMQQRHVWEEAFRCVNHCREGIKALFGITGRKGSAGGSSSGLYNTGAQPRTCSPNWVSWIVQGQAEFLV